MKEIQINTILELIDSENFRKRPNMYLGKNSITRLRIFMLGYETCEQFNSLNSKDSIPSFNLFYNWICKYYKETGSYNWDGIILKNCNDDEELALETFFLRYDEFKSHKPIKIMNCKLDDLKNELFLIQYTKGFGSTLNHVSGKINMYQQYYETEEEALSAANFKHQRELKWELIPIERIDEIFQKIK